MRVCDNPKNNKKHKNKSGTRENIYFRFNQVKWVFKAICTCSFSLVRMLFATKYHERIYFSANVFIIDSLYIFALDVCSSPLQKKKKKKSPNDSCVNNNNKHVSNDAFILMLKFFLHAFKSFRIVLLSSNRMHVYICKLWSMEGTERKYIAKYLLSNFISHKMADNIILYIKQTVLFQKKKKNSMLQIVSVFSFLFLL